MEFRGGRAERAVQLHSLQRKVRQAKSELKALKMKNAEGQVNEPNFEHSADLLLDDVEDLLKSIKEKNEMKVDEAINGWERRLCRQERAAAKMAI